MKKTAEGQGKQAILTALGVDHCLNLVVAVSTRLQADKDLVAVHGTMGVILDPSVSENRLTARIGIDATKALYEKAVRCRIPDEAKDFAKRLIAARSRKAGLLPFSWWN